MMSHMTLDTAGEDWDEFQRRWNVIRRNIVRMSLPPGTKLQLDGIGKKIAQISLQPETLRHIAAINKETIASISNFIESSAAYDDLRKSLSRSLSHVLATSSLSRAAEQALEFRDEIGAESFDEFANEGQKQDLLADAPWRLTDVWQNMSQERRIRFEWLLAGVIWFFVLWAVVGIEVNSPVIERILEGVGLSPHEIASYAAAIRPTTMLAKRYLRSHPIDKKVKRYVPR
jgi:hypothetical protein